MTPEQALIALKQSFQKLDHRINQISNQPEISRVETDLLLSEIQELYAKGLDLKDQASGKTANPNPDLTTEKPTEAHSEEQPLNDPDSSTADPFSDPSDNLASAEEESFTSDAISESKDQAVEEPSDFAESSHKGSDNPTTDDKQVRHSSNEKDSASSTESAAQWNVSDDEEMKHYSADTKEVHDKHESSEDPEVENQAGPSAKGSKDSQDEADPGSDKGQAFYEGIRDGSNGSNTNPKKAEKGVAVNEHQANQPGSQALYEKFEGQQPSLHEQLMAKNAGRSLDDKLKNKPISDLKSAIGLNERAKFIRELFQGQRDAYFLTLEQINLSDNYHEAVRYLENSIKATYDWDEQNETVQAFMELVYRRFVDSASST